MRLPSFFVLSALLAPLGHTALAADAAAANKGKGAEPLSYTIVTVAAVSSNPKAEAMNQQCSEALAAQQPARAEPLCQQALSEIEKTDPNSKHHANAISNMASLRAQQGDVPAAEAGFRRALAMYESVMGPNHLTVATSLSQLAGLYYQNDRYAEAEPLYRRALEVDERALGPDHPEVAKDLYNLATTLAQQGKAKEAEDMHQRCLVLREKILGSEDPAVARSLIAIAGGLAKEGRVEEAERAFQRAVKIDEQALGADHPETRYARTWLARLQAQRVARVGQ